MITSIGFPVMHKEENEKRAFLPGFIRALAPYAVDVFLEEGYGAKMGFSAQDYTTANPRVQFVSREEVMKKNLVIVLRAPGFAELDLMLPGSCLLSMLHYESRPLLLAKLKEKGIIPFSIDSIVGDDGKRLVVNYRGTAWGGVREAFRELVKAQTGFFSADRNPTRVSIIGMGNLGIEAARAALGYGSEELHRQAQEAGLPGVVPEFLEVETTRNREGMKRILALTDILVDATRRQDYARYVVSNDLLAYLPPDAVILDLAADPYNTAVTPLQVKAIEGLPYGTLDQYIFYPDDPAYREIPPAVSTVHRRVAVSCSAWPGVLPGETMEVYGSQLAPFVDVLLKKEPAAVRPNAPDAAERAIARACGLAPSE